MTRRWLVRAAVLAVVAAVTVMAVRLIGQVDWDAVWGALEHLDWWQVPVLAALLVVRQVLNSLPLSLYIAGVTPYRATLNDQVGVMIGTMLPPPSDYALRTAMFRSWDVPVAKGVAGALLHKLTFYIVRYAAPAVGMGILVASGERLGIRLADLGSIALAVGILVALLLVMRSTALARVVGRNGGRVVRRFRRSVDPEAWAEGCARFHDNVAARFHRGFPFAVAALVGMLALDVVMILLSARFVGLGGEVGTGVIVAAYLVAFPLTLFPFNGIGLVEAAVVGAITAAGGHSTEAGALAAMITWRVFFLGGPMIMGIASLLIWQHTSGVRLGLREMISRPDEAH